MKNLVITGGGSGGHILPLISLLQMIDESSQYRQVVDNIYRFGEKKGMEYKFFQQYSGSFQYIHPQFISILSGKYRRETIWISRWRNLRDLFLFPLGIIQSLYWILIDRIDIVFCKGGYVSLPVVIAAWLLRKKIYVHDSDTTPGLTTRLASRFATQNFSGFPNTLHDTICVGQILSEGLIQKPIDQLFDLPKDRLIILVAGGSLGAQKLYHGVLQAIKDDEFFQKNCFFVFINGNNIIEKKYLPDDKSHILITDLITDQAMMGYLYEQADLGIVRGGTTTLAECKLFDIPLAIVPLPVTHDQAKNAQYYVDNYNDILINQNDKKFISLLYSTILKTKKKHITLSFSKTKTSIQKAKKIILDMMLLS